MRGSREELFPVSTGKDAATAGYGQGELDV